MKTLYLIDGYAQFFRAYHAIRNPMTSPVTKEPTNMTFGFVGMLLKLLRANDPHLQDDGAPAYLAVALDVSGDTGTFRSQLYPDYKANRDAPPEDLFPQVERCLKMLEAIGVPILGAEGFEADDVIATIASTYSTKHPDVRVRIVSKDKDLKQLLGSGTPATEMYDIHTGDLITAGTLAEETGIEPGQVIDMLALMGDTVDNVPGVPGVGPKTAAQLIAEFGDLDAVIAEATADKPKKDWLIKGKRRENIAAFADKLPLSRELVALRHDTPVELDLDAASVAGLKLAELDPIFRELGFGRYRDDLKELLGQADEPAKPTRAAPDPGGFGGLFDQSESAVATPADGTHHVVRTKDELDALIARCFKAPVVAVDTETTALRPMRADLAGVCLAVEEGEGHYIPVRSPEPETHLDEATVVAALRPMLEDPGVPKVGHNLKYDLIVLRRAGIDLRGFVPDGSKPDIPAGDTMIASYLIDASRSSHSMDALTQALLGRQNLSIKDLIGTGKNQKRFDQVPLEQAAPYAAEDADITLRLANAMLPQLRAMDLFDLYATLEMPLVNVLAALEMNGIAVDRAELDAQRERLEGRITELRARIEDEAMAAVGRGFDPDSPKQLAGVLFNKPDHEDPGLGLRVIKKRKTGPSTDAEVLEKLDADPDIETPIPRLILDLRQLTKLVGTYLTSLADEIHDTDNRIHASFNQTVAATGRLSSSDPNLQNIPIRTDLGREIRKAFVAPEGRVLVSADYSQIELRLLAHLSDDPALIEAFHAGEDIHRAVAAQIHGVAPDDVTREQRDGAKMVNFGIIYGVTPFGLARRLGVSNSEAAEIIDGYKKRFAGITTFLAECVAQAQSKGYVETMMKRRRPITEIDSNNPSRRALAERTAINSVVQGSAADLIKIAMVDLQSRLESPEPGALADARMLLQIHDELVFETPQAAAEPAEAVICERMEAAMDLKVPLKVESAVSHDWFSGK